MKSNYLIFSILFFILSAPSYAQEVVLLVHPSLENNQFSIQDIKKTFLGRNTNNENGASLSPCYLDTKIVSNKLLKLTNKSKETYRRYWNKRLFSGAGTPPKTYSNPAKLYEHVSSKNGAICLSTPSSEIPEGIVVIALE